MTPRERLLRVLRREELYSVPFEFGTTQRGPMMSVSMWREWYNPRLARVIQGAKDANPAMLAVYHSDGQVEPFMDDLLEIGVDVLNPIQPECMDPAALMDAYGDRVSFWGTVGTQTTMPFGSVEEVRAIVVSASTRWVGVAAWSSPPPMFWNRTRRSTTCSLWLTNRARSRPARVKSLSQSLEERVSQSCRRDVATGEHRMSRRGDELTWSAPRRLYHLMLPWSRPAHSVPEPEREVAGLVVCRCRTAYSCRESIR